MRIASAVRPGFTFYPAVLFFDFDVKGFAGFAVVNGKIRRYSVLYNRLIRRIYFCYDRIIKRVINIYFPKFCRAFSDDKVG